MQTKPISPLAHSVIDYTLVSSLLVVPTLMKLNKNVKQVYAVEALGLLAYVALTKTPAAIKPLIPFRLHGKIDPFNVAGFAIQTLIGPFRKHKKALIFNLVFTALSAATVLLTDWSQSESAE